MKVRRIVILIISAVIPAVAALAQKGMAGKVHALPEITVKVKPVEQRGDTLNYNVAAFKDEGDHYLIDVLKKMPGIEIADDGRITYKGNSINKFNIEGQDLLGNRYNQATRSLPVEAVAQVQVMENDQPVKIMKGRSFSDKATLNIKLKKGYKQRPFGEVALNGGYGEEFLLNGDATLINVGRKNQLFLTAKVNNTGEDLSDLVIEHIDLSNYMVYVPLPRTLMAETGRSMLAMNKKRYLFNKSATVSLNHQVRLGKDATLRSNFVWYGTKDRSSDSTFNRYDGDYQVSLANSNRLRMKQNVMNLTTRYELNSQAVYVTDELTGSIGWERPYSNLLTNDQGVSQSIKRQPMWLKNSLQLVARDATRMYQINSLTRIYSNGEDLFSTSSVPAYNAVAFYRHREIVSNNSLMTSFLVFGRSLDLTYNLNYKDEKVSTTSVRYISNALTTSYSLTYKRGKVMFSLPLRLLSFKQSFTQGSQTKLFVSPGLTWMHDLTPKLQLKTNIGYNSAEQENFYTQDSLRTSYRTVRSFAGSLGISRITSAGVMLNYADMASLFTWYLMGTLSIREQDFQDEYVYTGEHTKISVVREKARMQSLFLTTNFDKTFSEPRLILKGNVSFTRMKMPVRQNGAQADISSNVLTAGLDAMWNKLRWINVSCRSICNFSWQDKSRVSSATMLRNWQSTLKLLLLPVKGLSLSAELEHNETETVKGQFANTTFVDMNARWEISKRVSLNFSVTNLFNRKLYRTASFTGFNYFYYEAPLRGTELIAGLRMSI